MPERFLATLEMAVVAERTSWFSSGDLLHNTKLSRISGDCVTVVIASPRIFAACGIESNGFARIGWCPRNAGLVALLSGSILPRSASIQV
jgi:hypothetical protein